MNDIHIKLGEVLKLEREARKIALEDASDQLKISVENLQIVEEGRVDDSPSELYFGLFAKSYAEFLGIDYAATMEAIKAEFGELEPELKGSGSGSSKEESSESDEDDSSDAKPADSESRKMLGWIGIGLMVVIIALLIWIIAFGGGVDSLNSPNEDGTEASTDETTQPASSIIDNYEFGTPPTDAPAPIKFRMVAREQCWSTVLADGDTAIFRNLVPGRQYDLTAQYRLIISIAHPRVVSTWLNDKEVDLSDPQSRRISRVEVTQINLEQFMAPSMEPEPVVTTPAVVPPPASSQTENQTPATTPQPSTPKPSEVDSLTQDTAGGL